MIWRAVTYGFPEAAFLLFILPILIFGWFSLNRYRAKQLAFFADEELLNELLEKRDPFYFWTKVVLCCLVWVLAVLALMEPRGNEHYISAGKKTAQKKTDLNKRKMHDIIFLIDVSQSMGVADSSNGRTREEIAKGVSDDLIRRLKGENVSLFAFTSTTLQIVPPTQDYLFTRLMLQQLQLNEEETSGTDIKQALEVIKRKMLDMPYANAKTVILLTDGEDTSEEKEQTILEAVKSLAEEHWSLFIVGIGTKTGGIVPEVTYEGHPVVSKLNESLLRQLSIVGKGQLFIAQEMSLSQIAQQISQAIEKRDANLSKLGDDTLTGASSDLKVYDEYFQIPLSFAIFSLMLMLILPNSRKRTLPTTETTEIAENTERE